MLHKINWMFLVVMWVFTLFITYVLFLWNNTSDMAVNTTYKPIVINVDWESVFWEIFDKYDYSVFEKTTDNVTRWKNSIFSEIDYKNYNLSY